jgi:hypothetical protein
MVVCISLGFTIITFTAVFIEWFVFDPILPYVTLFYGVFIGYYSLRDIYEDCILPDEIGEEEDLVNSTKRGALIAHNDEGSDAMACHKLIPCCLPRCVGVQFWLIAFSFQVLGIYLALVWLVSTYQ